MTHFLNRSTRGSLWWMGLVMVLIGSSPLIARPDFTSWLEGVRKQAMERGISREVVDRALSDLEPLPRVVERDRNQAEFTVTFDTYLGYFVTPQRIETGREKLRKHRDLLERVETKYGVSPRVIVAIWGVESRYNQSPSTTPVVRALATLAYDRRRSSYFRTQLMAALEILDRGDISFDRMKGSWAGAMGQPQFMPTSYLTYARDFDGDGQRDIWDSEADVFASIANYLNQHGWKHGETWGVPVELPESGDEEGWPPHRNRGCRAMKNLTQDRPLSRWRDLGVKGVPDSTRRSIPDRASLVRPDGTNGPSFLVFSNYRVLLRYNCANHYALAVGILSDRLIGRAGAVPSPSE